MREANLGFIEASSTVTLHPVHVDQPLAQAREFHLAICQSVRQLDRLCALFPHARCLRLPAPALASVFARAALERAWRAMTTRSTRSAPIVQSKTAKNGKRETVACVASLRRRRFMRPREVAGRWNRGGYSARQPRPSGRAGSKGVGSRRPGS